MQSFLRLTGYFFKFIPQYSTLGRPLTALIKKDTKYCFLDEQINDFQLVKDALIIEPVLKLYCTESETELVTDAS